MVKIVHIAAMELFTVYILWNVVRLWLRKPPVKGLLNFLAIILGIVGIVAGIFLFARYYHFHSPAWLQLKFVLIALSVFFGIAGSVKTNKWMLLSSFMLNVSVVIIANLKF